MMWTTTDTVVQQGVRTLEKGDNGIMLGLFGKAIWIAGRVDQKIREPLAARDWKIQKRRIPIS